MEKITVNKLIQWMKEHNHTDSEIVDCIDFITADKKRESKKEDEKK